MSRGRSSKKAYDAAVAVAPARGQVIPVQSWPGSACHFLLITPQGIVSVCVQRTRRIQAEIGKILQDYRDTLNQIRGSAHCAGISKEFWLWCPYGTMRFFVIDGFTLEEISVFGLPLVPPVTEKFIRKSPEKSGSSKNNPGVPAGSTPAPQPGPGPAGEPGLVTPAASRPGAREPPYVRYLRKRNAPAGQEKEEAARARKKPPGPGRNAPPSGETVPPPPLHPSGGDDPPGVSLAPGPVLPPEEEDR